VLEDGVTRTRALRALSGQEVLKVRSPFTVALIGLALTLSACGGADEGDATAASASGDESTLQERVDQLEAEKLEDEATERAAKAKRKLKAEKRAQEKRRKAREAKRAAAREREQAAAEAPEPEPEQASSDAGGGIVVPDVVGLDHQAAQNALQGEGLWSLDEKDCTGQGRLLLFDRNWEVVSLDPPAGSQVSEDTTITLCSVKQGE
jgi:hypothetical protein